MRGKEGKEDREGKKILLGKDREKNIYAWFIREEKWKGREKERKGERIAWKEEKEKKK